MKRCISMMFDENLGKVEQPLNSKEKAIVDEPIDVIDMNRFDPNSIDWKTLDQCKQV